VSKVVPVEGTVRVLPPEEFAMLSRPFKTGVVANACAPTIKDKKNIDLNRRIISP
jgi:hypothetical protein